MPIILNGNLDPIVNETINKASNNPTGGAVAGSGDDPLVPESFRLIRSWNNGHDPNDVRKIEAERAALFAKTWELRDLDVIHDRLRNHSHASDLLIVTNFPIMNVMPLIYQPSPGTFELRGWVAISTPSPVLSKKLALEFAKDYAGNPNWSTLPPRRT